MNAYTKASKVFTYFSGGILLFLFLSVLGVAEFSPDAKTFLPVFFVFSGFFLWMVQDVETIDKIRLFGAWLMTTSLWGVAVFSVDNGYGYGTSESMIGVLTHEEKLSYIGFFISLCLRLGFWFALNDIKDLASALRNNSFVRVSLRKPEKTSVRKEKKPVVEDAFAIFTKVSVLSGNELPELFSRTIFIKRNQGVS